MGTRRQLEVLREVERLGSMNKAASELGLNRSTVMRHVRALEASEGRELVRTRHGVAARVTRSGRGLNKRAAPLLKVPPAE